MNVSEDDLQATTSLGSDDFGAPFFYRFPLGWFVIIALVGGFVFVTWQRMRELG